MRTAVYARLRDPRHEMLSAYARKCGMTVNEVIERLVDQLLLQVEPRFRAPRWLVEAIEQGYLPFEMPKHVESGSAEDDEALDGGAPREDRVLRAL